VCQNPAFNNVTGFLWIVVFRTRLLPAVGLVSPYRFYRLLMTDMELAVAIDPVIVLAEELRSTEATLRDAAKDYVRGNGSERVDAIQRLLFSMKNLNHQLLETVPTSALGAAELIRLLIQRLPPSHARHADHFSEVAQRLQCGQRAHADLVWLRAMQMSLRGSGRGGSDPQVAPLLRSAIVGAARPVLVFRTVTAARNMRARSAMVSPPN
jgi:hypothetical protein